MAANQGPTTTGARPSCADVPTARGEGQDYPPPKPPRTAALKDDPGAVPVSQNPGGALAAPVVPAPPPDAFLTPPLPEEAQLPEVEAGAVAATYRPRVSRQNSANWRHRVKSLAKAIAVASEDFEETDPHVRALPETF
ncbi:uncharacterized protein LOC142768393 [Rhipicephalus microplus]|uniref:uncharacterized protein LOC142768393 n=1 Tax=Rhipicephalus microplus TaxID=6941 RepID=UPI003F6BC978